MGRLHLAPVCTGAILDAVFVSAVTFRRTGFVRARSEAHVLAPRTLFETVDTFAAGRDEQRVAAVEDGDTLLHRLSAAGREQRNDQEDGTAINAHRSPTAHGVL